MSQQWQAQIHAPDDVRLDAVALPEPGPRDAIVRVAACGICGSDVGYLRLGGMMGPTGTPMPIGHEFSGTVEALGREVKGISPGDRVVVDPQGADNQIGNGGSEGGFTPRILVRNVTEGRCLIPIPDELPFDLAALAEPLGVGMQAVNRSRAQAGEKAVVFGAGPIGLAAVATLHQRGIEEIVAVDFSNTRLGVARKLGAAHAFNPSEGKIWPRIREAHGESEVYGNPAAATEIYIEASGAPDVIPQIIGRARSGARVSVVALHRQEVPVSFLNVMMKEIELIGSIAQPENWDDMLDMLVASDLSAMITHHFELEQFMEGMAVAQDPEAGAKVMIHMNSETV
ncbi:MAG: zinc-binding dehydrogenase [Myxococcota bacterium]|nr:zinc-binding dehydrogenase [Myxococcota bacterium]